MYDWVIGFCIYAGMLVMLALAIYAAVLVGAGRWDSDPRDRRD